MIAAVLPLKISGRHYASNLNRCDLLFSTFRHFGLGAIFAEILIIVPGKEQELISQHARAWSDFPIRILPEEEFLSVFREYGKPHQVRPWHRQQIIKLASAKLVSSPFFLTLDPDVIALRKFTCEDIIRDGRALLEPEARSVHSDWWLASAALLGVEAALDRPGISVTPAVLSRDICLALFERLEAKHGNYWIRVLLENYAIDWTEYTLYYLTAENTGLLEQYHRFPAAGEPRLLAPYKVWSRTEFDKDRIINLFAVPQVDYFTVIQSNTGIDVKDIASLISPYVPLSLAPAPIHKNISAQEKLREVSGAAIRKMMGQLRRLR